MNPGEELAQVLGEGRKLGEAKVSPILDYFISFSIILMARFT
jgi:hypothetical protein